MSCRYGCCRNESECFVRGIQQDRNPVGYSRIGIRWDTAGLEFGGGGLGRSGLTPVLARKVTSDRSHRWLCASHFVPSVSSWMAEVLTAFDVDG